MTSFLEQVIAGIVSGSIYASVAVALVLTYKTTRVVNFAQGAMGTLTAYIAWSLMQNGLGYWLSFMISLLCAFVLGALLALIFENPAEDLPVLNKIILTLGLLLVLESIMGWLYSYGIKAFPSPFTGKSVTIGGVIVVAQDIGVLATALAVTVATVWFFRFTTLGLEMRAVAYDQEVSRSLGIRVNRLLSLGWGLSAVLGGIAGLLVAPTLFLSPHMMSGVMIYAIAAAIIGGMESLGGAVIGGILLGITENLVGNYVAFVGPSLKFSVALFALLIILLFRSEGLFGRAETERA